MRIRRGYLGEEVDKRVEVVLSAGVVVGVFEKWKLEEATGELEGVGRDDFVVVGVAAADEDEVAVVEGVLSGVPTVGEEGSLVFFEIAVFAWL